MKKLILPVFIALLAAVSFAQATDKVILVSDVTSVDMLIAKAAGEKAGIPVLVLENGMLDDETRADLTNLSVKTIYLVGGPAVIKPETETELGVKYTVVRLWGHERTGTSLEVLKHFWTEGSPCVVIADDTKNSDDDTEVQSEASELAVVSRCPFIPVPKGTIPAEVLEAINDLNITDAKFVGRLPSAEFRLKLAKFRLKEIIGDKNQVEDEIEKDQNETKKLVVVAAPNWKYVLGHGGHAGRHTIVRIVSSVDAVPRLVTLINTRNITTVFVTGNPTLAEEIAKKFNESGINVTKVSAERAAKVARELLKKTIKDWEERRKDAQRDENRNRTRMRVSLTEWLDKLTERLNYLETELASLNLSGADQEKIKIIQTKIDEAQKQISAIKDYIENSNFDTARIRISKILSDIENSRWMYRRELKIDELNELHEEEDSVEETRGKFDFDSMAGRLAELRSKCNTTSMDALVEKSRTLKSEIDAAVAAGDYQKAAQLSVELRNAFQQVKAFGNVCERGEKMEERFKKAMEDRLEQMEKIRARARK